MINRPYAVFTLAMAIALIGSYASAEDWTMSRFDTSQTGFTNEAIKLPLSIAWEYGAGRFPGNTSSPICIKDTVYFASGDRVYAVNAKTGSLRWRYPAEQQLNASVKGSPLYYEGKIYFGASDGNLYALNASDGKYLWAFKTGGAIRGSAIVANGVLYVGSDDNALYAIDPDSGESKWAGGFRTQDDIAMTPCVAGGLVIIASQDSNVYAANEATGKIRWVYRVPAAIKIPPVVLGDFVFLGAGNAITCLSLRSGQQRWSIPLPADPSAAPAAANNVIYVPCKNRKIYAVSIAGKLAWPKPIDLDCDTSCPPTVANNLLFVACERGTVSAYSVETGDLKWKIGLMPSLTIPNLQYTNASASPIISNGALYVLTDDGTLRCFRNDAPDSSGPEIYNLTPRRGIAMSGAPPILFSATIFDTTTGVDPNSIKLTLDGEVREHRFDPVKWQVIYETPVTQPLRPLPDGRHEVMLSVSDWKGNSTTEKWSFVVDNSLKAAIPPRAVAPSAETKPAQQQDQTGRSRGYRRAPREVPRISGKEPPNISPQPEAPPSGEEAVQ